MWQKIGSSAIQFYLFWCYLPLGDDKTPQNINSEEMWALGEKIERKT